MTLHTLQKPLCMEYGSMLYNKKIIKKNCIDHQSVEVKITPKINPTSF